MEIVLSRELGYCYGVRDAVDLVIEASKTSSVQTWGPIIHNPLAIKELEDEHSIYNIENLEDLKANNLAIRAHGVSPNVMKSFKGENVDILDATCPFVKKTQELAKDLVEDGYFVVILGKKNHPEVLGIEGYVSGHSLVVQTLEDLEKLTKHKKIGIVFQSTITIDDTRELLPEITKYAQELKIHTTICGVTKTRQKEARRISQIVDLMIIIGAGNSSNSKKLYEIAKEINKNSIQINDSKELDKINFAGVEKVGIVTGTSTPDSVISLIIKELERRAEENRDLTSVKKS